MSLIGKKASWSNEDQRQDKSPRRSLSGATILLIILFWMDEEWAPNYGGRGYDTFRLDEFARL